DHVADCRLTQIADHHRTFALANAGDDTIRLYFGLTFGQRIVAGKIGHVLQPAVTPLCLDDELLPVADLHAPVTWINQEFGQCRLRSLWAWRAVGNPGRKPIIG